MKQFSKLKSRKSHSACVICEEACVYEQTYIDETGRNVELRWEEHESISKYSEPAKHLKKKKEKLKPQVSLKSFIYNNIKQTNS